MLSYAQEFAIEEPFIGSGSRVLALPPLSTSGGFVQLMEFLVLGATASRVQRSISVPVLLLRAK